MCNDRERPKRKPVTRHETADRHVAHRRTERAAALRTAFEATPERFVRGAPTPPALPRAVWINKPRTEEESSDTPYTKFCPEVSHSC